MSWDDKVRLTDEELTKKFAKADTDTANYLTKLQASFAELRNLIRSGRNMPEWGYSDGSFGLNTSTERLDEAELWANKEIRSRHGIKWP